MPKNLEGNIQYQSLISKWSYFKKTEKEAAKKRMEAESGLLATVADYLQDNGANNFPLGLEIVTSPNGASFSIVNKK
jgi:hypothetical protein